MLKTYSIKNYVVFEDFATKISEKINKNVVNTFFSLVFKVVLHNLFKN